MSAFSNKSLRALLIVVVIQAIMIVALWFGPAAQPAYGQIADPGAQRAQIIQLLTANNEKLDKIISQLDGNTFPVRVARADPK